MKKLAFPYMFLLVLWPILGQDGLRDVSFGNNGVVLEDYNSSSLSGDKVTQFEDGSIITGGSILLSGNGHAVFLSRFFEDGQPDLTFGNNGLLLTDIGIQSPRLNALIPLPDGSFYASVSHLSASYLRKYLSDGTLDVLFGTNGQVQSPIFQVTGMTTLSDDKMLYVGQVGGSLAFIRIFPDGTVDTSYGDNGYVLIPSAPNQWSGSSAVIGDDDSMVVAIAGGLPQQQKLQLRKYSSEGQQDLSFGNNGVFEKFYIYDGIAPKIQLYNDSRIVVVVGKAISRKFNLPIYYPEVMRFSENGVLDTNFGSNGVQEIMGTTFRPLKIIIQANSRILIAGNDTDIDDPSYRMVRLFNTGVRDYSFIENSYTNYEARQVIQQLDGKILVTGNLDLDHLILVRYNNNPLGIENFETTDFKLYPVPTSGRINIESSESITGEDYFIVDAIGRTIAEGTINSKLRLDVSRLKSGVYFLTIQNHTERFIKE